jgi:hypothetical protein
MLFAIESGRIGTVRYLMEHGIGNIMLSINLAAYHGHLDIIKYIAAEKIIDFMEPFQYAVNNNKLHVLKYFVRIGQNYSHTISLLWPAKLHFIDTLRYLFDNGADINRNRNILVKITDLRTIEYFLENGFIWLRHTILMTGRYLSKLIIQESDFSAGSQFIKMLKMKHGNHLFETIKKVIKQRTLSSQRLLNCRMYHDIIINAITA